MKVVNVHSDFVLSPLLEILSDGLMSLNALGDGVEIMPVVEYHVQSVFLKLTGAQEQKMKCICWDLASNDYFYRYEYLNNKSYGEHSDYKSKSSIYNDLNDVISRVIPNFSVHKIWDDVELSDEEENKSKAHWKQDVEAQIAKSIKEAEKEAAISEEKKREIRERIEQAREKDDSLYIQRTKTRKEKVVIKLIDQYKQLLSSSCYYTIFPRQYHDFLKRIEELKKVEGLCMEKSLLPSHLSELYTHEVFFHRNRCAHNLTSYQSNLPSLDVIANQKEGEDNYFVRFWLIILIDEIFMRLYKYYIEHAEYV